MTTTKPNRTYSGVFTDTQLWERFEHRAGDVFICVPPKSGTTWMQSICGLLILGDPEADIAYQILSPWIDFRFSAKPIQARFDLLAAQSHQRFIKTHSPLDGIPYFPDCIYLVCHRHPLDVHFSMHNHVNNMKIGHLDHLYTDDMAANFDAFLNNGLQGDGLDQPSLELITRHFATATAMAHRTNVHLFHYDTLCADLHGQMHRAAKAIGVSHPANHFEKLVAAATFKSMKTKADLIAPGSENGLYKDPDAFFHSGTSGKWVGKLSSDQLAAYRKKIATYLPPEGVVALEKGQQPSNQSG